jgi:hypothetical protein
MITPVYKWLEAGSSNNVTITNNIVLGCHDVPIGVYTEGGDGTYGPSGGHHDITITQNTIVNSANPGIFVSSTTNLVLGTENIIKTPDKTLLLEPYKKSYYGRGDDPNREIYFVNVDGISGSVLSSFSSSARQAPSARRRNTKHHQPPNRMLKAPHKGNSKK